MRKPEDELADLEQRGLLRGLRSINNPNLPILELEGRKLINFSSNDYLGFAQHPALIEAAAKALQDYGTGSTASRLICGSLDIFHQLEEKIAPLKKAEAALAFANGFATAMGAIPAIVGKGDTVILDKLSHACLIDAAKLSGATLRIFPHNDLNKLERLLISAKGRTLVVTESLFSMDGDLCPLTEIVELKEKHGALLFLDEAHAVGILGQTGQGLAEDLDLQYQVEFQMGTLGKALGSAGGYLATSKSWHELLINKARSFIYSTAPPPSQAAASLASLDLLNSAEGIERRLRLKDHSQSFDSPTPIIPRIIGENSSALSASATLLKKGFLVPAMRYPTVPQGTARLRITLSAAHCSENIHHLKEALASL
ncbi:8-amino-7-oxononanoate synthase [Akkermansiaceae bacterium]|nr:8-amino-7-oxononanoate synthase [Akkermansiaceae bacterium]